MAENALQLRKAGDERHHCCCHLEGRAGDVGGDSATWRVSRKGLLSVKETGEVQTDETSYDLGACTGEKEKGRGGEEKERRPVEDCESQRARLCLFYV